MSKIQEIRPGRSASPVNGLAFNPWRLDAHSGAAIPMPGLPRKLRQLCCPNSDHAKFFSITQARESRCPHVEGGSSAVLNARFEAGAPRSRRRSVGIANEFEASPVKPPRSTGQKSFAGGRGDGTSDCNQVVAATAPAPCVAGREQVGCLTVRPLFNAGTQSDEHKSQSPGRTVVAAPLLPDSRLE
jgi:hypothetical protein